MISATISPCAEFLVISWDIGLAASHRIFEMLVLTNITNCLSVHDFLFLVVILIDVCVFCICCDPVKESTCRCVHKLLTMVTVVVATILN